MALGQRKYINNFRTSLSSAVTNSATTMYINSSTGLPTLTGSDYYYLTVGNGAATEIVKVTARTSLTLTVVRAQEGTTGVAWASGSAVELRATAASYTALGGYAYTMPDDGTVGQVLTTNGSGVLSWSTIGYSGTFSIAGTSAQPAEIRLAEDTDNGTNYVGFKAPVTLAGDQVWELPAADGASGEVLTTNGAGVLQFSASSGIGALTYFDTQTASASANLNFTSIPDCAFMHFVLLDIILATDDKSLQILTSSDNGSSYDNAANDYNCVFLGRTGATTSAQSTLQNPIYTSQAAAGLDPGNAAGETINGEIWLYNPAGTNQTYLRWSLVFKNADGSMAMSNGGAARVSAADVDAIRFQSESGNITSGTIIAYKLAKT